MEDQLYLIALSDTLIEGAHWSLRGRPRLREWHSEWLEPPGAPEAAEAHVLEQLEQFLDMRGWRSEAAVLVLPSSWTMLRKLEFPFADASKIRQALPFELEGEMLDPLPTFHYTFSIHPRANNTAEVRIQLISRALFARLQEVFQGRDLHLRDVRSASCALQALRQHEASEFQVYVGPEGVFINQLTLGIWGACHTLHSRLGKLLSPLAGSGLAQVLGELGASADSEALEPQASLRQELRRLAGELTRSLRMQSVLSDSHIHFHGIFAPFLTWDGLVVRVREFPLPEAQTLLQDPLAAPAASVRRDPPQDLEELKRVAEERERQESSGSSLAPYVEERGIASVSGSLLHLNGRKAWGLLEDLKLSILPGTRPQPLGLIVEANPIQRFARRHRGALSVTALLLLLLLLGQSGRLLLHQDLLRQELRLTEQRTQQLLAAVGVEARQAREGLITLRERIAQRQTEIEVGQSFLQRDYSLLSALNRISGLIQVSDPRQYQIDRIEYTSSRFALNGLIDSYDRLQELKNRLLAMPEFSEKRIVESNRKSPEGIVFRISIDL